MSPAALQAASSTASAAVVAVTSAAASVAASAPAPKLDLNNTFGALLIGIILSAMLYGVTCLQVFYYFNHYSDTLDVKLVVLSLWCLETLHSIFGIHAIYHYLILNFANPPALAEATWSASSTLAVTSCIMLIVQMFYAKRIYHVSRKNYALTGLIALLAVVHFGVGLSVTIRSLQLKFFALFINITDIVDTSLALSVVTDVLIAGSLSYYLNSSRSGIKSTDTIINRLMIYAINNGILTSVFDIVTLGFVTGEPHNLIFLGVFQVVGNLYSNSVIATLNSRHSTSDSAKRGVTSLTDVSRGTVRLATIPHSHETTVGSGVTGIDSRGHSVTLHSLGGIKFDDHDKEGNV